MIQPKVLLLGSLALATLPALSQDFEDLDPVEIPSLIDDLHDDDIRWNARRAIGALVRHGEAAIPDLRAALHSKDYQQRQGAASALRRILTQLERPPSDRLIEVTVEGLRDDPLHFLSCMSNAEQGRDYLLSHVDRATEHLLRSRQSVDRQQRFLSAYILARSGLVDDIEKTAEILIGHLADNDIRSDAGLSCFALHKLGHAVLPYLEPYRGSDDRQQREAIELIIYDIEYPPRDDEEARERKSFHSLSEHFPDPCYNFGRQSPSGLGDRRKRQIFRDVWSGEIAVPSLDELWERHGSRLTFKWDSIEPKTLTVAIGFKTDTFDRRLTLRIWSDQTIESWDERHAEWIVEHRPR